MERHVYDAKLDANGTIINGTVVKIPINAVQAERPKAVNVTDGDNEDAYDSLGAMQFIIATVLVYSILSMVCTLIHRIKRVRGKGHWTHVQDENVHRYLKNEKTLKFDAHKMKLMYECNMISEKVKTFEEKQKLLELEKEMISPDFTCTVKKSRDKRQKYRKQKKRDIGGTVGKMGMSFFYLGNEPSFQNNIPEDVRSGLQSRDEAILTAEVPQLPLTDVSEGEDSEVLTSDLRRRTGEFGIPSFYIEDGSSFQDNGVKVNVNNRQIKDELITRSSGEDKISKSNTTQLVINIEHENESDVDNEELDFIDACSETSV